MQPIFLFREQAAAHERDLIARGILAFTEEELARFLSRWTTAKLIAQDHRAATFDADESAEAMQAVKEAAGAIMQAMGRRA